MDVKPFKAFRFDPRIVGDVGACVAPPYDVLDDAERDALCRRNRYNIAHITKGPVTAADGDGNNQYTRAAAYLQAWIAAGALKEDNQDTIYGYVQDFEINDMACRRLSFIALGKLEEFGQVVRPHEQVFAKPLLDRLSLERATAARFGLVFMLYDDSEGVADRILARAMGQASPSAAGAAPLRSAGDTARAEKQEPDALAAAQAASPVARASRPCSPGGARPDQKQETAFPGTPGSSLETPEASDAAEPLVDFTDQQAVRHRLYALTAPADIQAVEAMMRDKSCIIADGHHRYTVGLTYLRESGNPKARYQMMAFANTRQTGLVVLATHRLVGGLKDFQPSFLLDLKDVGFHVTRFQFTPQAGTKEQAQRQMLRMLAQVNGRQDAGRTQGRDALATATAFGIYHTGTDAFYVAVLDDPSRMAAAAPDRSHAWRALDVAVLQKLVLEGLLGLDEEKMGNPEYVEYVKDTPRAIGDLIRQVDAGHRQIAFFTNPVRLPQLAAVTDAGERMPHKSTYFYPKMYTGLTIQKL